MTEQEVEEFLNSEPDGRQIDISLSNGLVRSSKDMVKHNDNLFSVMHYISDIETWFTREAAREVLLGTRDPWEGDLPITV